MTKAYRHAIRRDALDDEPDHTGPLGGGITASCEICRSVKSIGAMLDVRICKACDWRKRQGIQSRMVNQAQGGLI